MSKLYSCSHCWWCGEKPVQRPFGRGLTPCCPKCDYMVIEVKV